MSLRLRRIAIDGFRKFREPMAIEGLTDGLNIVIEPNETAPVHYSDTDSR